MYLVNAGDKGVSVKLNPLFENKIFTDKTDDDQDVVIVKGRVVRVDNPSPAMGRALHEELPNPAGPDKGKGGALLVETDEDPTPIAQPLNEKLDKLNKDEQRAVLEAEAARLGLTLHEAPVNEGDATDLANKKTVTGQAVVPVKSQDTSSPSSDSGDSGAKK
jgi:hypothetical protein